MPLPRLIANINKRVFNPREVSKGDRPVLTHVGRTSGKTYRTPLDAHRIDGGYIFILVYGSKSDWVLNVLAAGTASLYIPGGTTIELTNPRLIEESEAWQLLPGDTDKPPGILNVHEFLRADAT